MATGLSEPRSSKAVIMETLSFSVCSARVSSSLAGHWGSQPFGRQCIRSTPSPEDTLVHATETLRRGCRANDVDDENAPHSGKEAPASRSAFAHERRNANPGADGALVIV